MRAAALSLLLGACSFSHGSLPGTGDGPPGLDASGDAGRDAPRPGPDAMADAKTCPADYVTLIGGQSMSRYKLYGYAQNTANVTTFDVAEQTCVTEGAHIAIPDDAQEIGAFDGVSQNPFQAGYWVGITDKATEGTYLTVLGAAAAYLPWALGQPNGGSAANCVVGYLSQLYDVDCTMPYVFVCECEL